MKKVMSLALVLLMVSFLPACSNSKTAEHNGKVCPPGTENSKTACNRTPPKGGSM